MCACNPQPSITLSLIIYSPSHWVSASQHSLKPKRVTKAAQPKQQPPRQSAPRQAAPSRSTQQPHVTLAIPKTESSGVGQQHPSPPKLTFVPAFLSKQPAVADDIKGRETCVADVYSPRPGYTSPTPRKARKNAKVGNLVKSLKAIRDSVQGDCIRFQSGQYPFDNKSSFDLNDPRTRATTHMDVTLRGGCHSWQSDNNQRLTVLGFVHSHIHRLSKRAVGPQGCWAWICFSSETKRQRDLQNSSKLRIYNPTIFHVSQMDTSDGVEWLVTCTQLNENYPDSLPPLPDPGEAAAAVADHAHLPKE